MRAFAARSLCRPLGYKGDAAFEASAEGVAVSDQNPWPPMWCALKHGALPVCWGQVSPVPLRLTVGVLARPDISHLESCGPSAAFLGSECVYFVTQSVGGLRFRILSMDFTEFGNNSHYWLDAQLGIEFQACWAI